MIITNCDSTASLSFRYPTGFYQGGRLSIPMYGYSHTKFTHVYTRKRCILRSLLHAIDFPTCYTKKFFDTLRLKDQINRRFMSQARRTQNSARSARQGGKERIKLRISPPLVSRFVLVSRFAQNAAYASLGS